MTSPEPIVPIITCFNRDDTINYTAVRAQVRRQLDAGNSILVCDTIGDFTSMTQAEKVRLCAEVVEEADNRVQIYANVGMPSTYQSVLLGREIAKLGICGVTVITPFFEKCSQADLVAHYSKVADSLERPVYLYNIPSRSTNTIDPETALELASHPNILGIKDSGGDEAKLDAYLAIAARRDDFSVYVGGEGLIHTALRQGAAGCMSDLGNILPKTLNRICTSFREGREQEAVKRLSLYCELGKDLEELGPKPHVIKQLLYRMNENVGTGRQPAPISTPDLDRKLGAMIEKYALV
ncbi:4-hydroxy-tetrahydrodipicolinate synthase [Cohaesibacter sp. ES.047]|uniref:dihydrodipicolinate synthase family protein n=1 Tax=Cohaesibacter sp. ES.047 TaxID=1798205 RepID=UPI000BB92994|nr:dihydrodipicolinate synthase family protein [Cohaesibacter sp. ES.047]SNY92959.1 4-hydroxy-tetrahydrodipicolinate synthase [Cohaesibacter sp. ES.047]